MMRKKNNKGTTVISYGLVTTARSNEKQAASSDAPVKPEKDKNKGSFSKIAAKINITVTGKGKGRKAPESPKSAEAGKGKESRENETLKSPKSIETSNEEETLVESPKTVETCTEQEPITGDQGLSIDNSFSIPQDQQPETGFDGNSVYDAISVEQDQQSETETEGQPEDNSLSVSLQESEDGNEKTLLNNSLQMQTGTNQKCIVCDKTVYLVDKVTANDRVYHKSCFRCHHCNGTLKLGNFNSFEGVLYCRPHFDQLYKQTGSLDKSFEGKPKAVKQEKPADTDKPTANKFSTMFARTTERCVGCNNTVYPTEKVTVNGTPYHRSCFKCSKGGCTISLSNYIAFEGRLYCKHHHIQLIKEKGNLSQLGADNGKDQVKDSDTEQEDNVPSSAQ